MTTTFTSEEFYSINKQVISTFSALMDKHERYIIQNMNDIIEAWAILFEKREVSLDLISPILNQIDRLEKHNIDLCADLLNSWEEKYIQSESQLITLFGQKLLGNWSVIVKNDLAKNALISHNFNPLSLFHINETMHSRLLMTLLDSKGKHGQGRLFLELFLNKIGIKSPESGNWKVTAEEGRIDILLKRDYPYKSVIIIENKSNGADDQPNQLYRYWHQEIYKATNECSIDFYRVNSDCFQIIYLTPTGKSFEIQSSQKPKGSRYPAFLPGSLPIEVKLWSFNEDIYDWVESCLMVLRNENHRMKEFLKQYQEIITTL